MGGRAPRSGRREPKYAHQQFVSPGSQQRLRIVSDATPENRVTCPWSLLVDNTVIDFVS